MACGRWDKELAAANFWSGKLFGKGLSAGEWRNAHPLRRLEPDPADGDRAAAEAVEMDREWAALEAYQRST